MKKLLAASLLALLSGQVHAQCADRYYYYNAKVLPTKIKNWQIYEDRSLEISKEIKDVLMMNEACSPANTGNSHNFTAYFNYIVPANLWSKIDKPLYKNLSIRLPNGALGNATAAIMTIDEHEQKQRQAFKQYSSENKIQGKITAIYIYIVREGVDQLYTPKLNVSYSKALTRDGYYFTEYKP
jgi:hypothetical protein